MIEKIRQNHGLKIVVWPKINLDGVFQFSLLVALKISTVIEKRYNNCAVCSILDKAPIDLKVSD